MSDLSEDAPLTPEGRRLIGWKEIAVYLGRGVRTAQRWEREFGLPVRRMGANRAESVFAFVDEVDGWLATSSAANARGDHQTQPPNDDDFPDTPGLFSGDDPPCESTVPPPDSPGDDAASPDVPLGRYRAWAWVFGVAALLLATVVVWREYVAYGERSSAGSPDKPASWSVEVDTLVVRNAAGHTLWSHKFTAPLRATAYHHGVEPPLAGLEDLEQDGRLEVWIGVSPAVTGNGAGTNLLVFNEDGSLRWEYQYEGTVRFGETTYSAPWHVHRVVATADPDNDSQRALWVVSRDAAEFPSVLQRLDVRTGKPLSEYWSNGWISAVALGRWQSKQVLFVGGASNENVAPGLAILDAGNPNGSAPAANSKYACASCQPGKPLAYVVFPKPERFRARAGTGLIQTITTGTDPTAVTATAAFVLFEDSYAAAVYRLDEQLRPRHVDAANEYRVIYERLVAERLIPPAKPDTVDTERELLPLLKWDAGTFVPVGKFRQEARKSLPE